MTVNINKLTEQSAGGQPVDISTAADVHIVPSGETHQVTVMANLDVAGSVTVKIDGEATGFKETLETKKTRIIYDGIVIGNASTSIINVDAGATGLAWGVFRQLV